MKTLLALLTLLVFADIGNAQKIIATNGTISNVTAVKGTGNIATDADLLTKQDAATALTLGTGSTQAQRALVTGTNGGMQTDIYLACTTGSNGLLGIGTEWAPLAAGTPDLFAQAEVSLPSYCAVHLIYSGSYQKFPDKFLFSPDITDGTQEIPSDYYNLYCKPGQKWYGNGSTIKMVNPKASALAASWGSQLNYRTMFGSPLALPVRSGTTILYYLAVNMDGIEFHDMTLDLNGSALVGSGSTGIVSSGIAMAGDNVVMDNIHVIHQVNSTNDGTESAALASGAQSTQWYVGINARNNRITNCTIDQPATADGGGITNRGSLEGIYLYGSTASLSATSGLLTDSFLENNYINLSGATGIQGISIGGGVDLGARNNTVIVSGSNASGFYQDTWDTTRAQFLYNHVAISGDQSIGFHFGDGVYFWRDYSICGNTVRMSGTNRMFGITAHSSSGPQYIQCPMITSNRIMLDGTNSDTLGIVVMSCTNAIVTSNEIALGIGHSVVTNSSTGAPFKLVYGNHSETGAAHLPWYANVPASGPWTRIASPSWGLPEMEIPASTGTTVNLLGSGTGSTAVQNVTFQPGTGITLDNLGNTITITNALTNVSNTAVSGTGTFGNGFVIFGGAGQIISFTNPTNLFLSSDILPAGQVSGFIAAAQAAFTAGTNISITSGTISVSGTFGTVTSVVGGTGISGGTITGSGTLSVNQAFSPTWTGTHTFSNNLVMNGTNNTAPNQVGVLPGSATIPTMDQVVSGVGMGHRMLQVGSNWAIQGLGGGSTDASNGGVTSTTGTSSGMLYYCPRGLASGAGVIDKRVAFSKPITVSATFIGNGITASPNTVFRFSLGKNNGSPPAIGAPTSRSIGFKLVFDTADTGHFYGEIHDGTSLTVSASSKANIDLSSSQIEHQVVVHSNGGTVKFYVDGSLVETLIGGPSTDTTLTGTGTLTLENVNTGDATTAGYIYTSWVSVFLGI